jgi:hypothetical protein
MSGSTMGQSGRRRTTAFVVTFVLICGMGIGTVSAAAGSARIAEAAAAPVPSVVNLEPKPGGSVPARSPVTLSTSVVAVTSSPSTTPAPLPTGTVTFSSGDVPIGTGRLDAAGQVEFTLPADSDLLTPGVHTFSAAYSGNAAFQASSGSATVTVYFNDYPPARPGGADRPFFSDISWLTAQRITTGYSDGGFHPNAIVNRQAMAAFLYRAANPGTVAPPCTKAAFTDVPVDSTFCAEIAWLVAAGIGTGAADGGFHPLVNVDRRAMAVLLYRFAHRGGQAPPVWARTARVAKSPGWPVRALRRATRTVGSIPPRS